MLIALFADQPALWWLGLGYHGWERLGEVWLAALVGDLEKMMDKFAEIQARAMARKGGAQALQDLLPKVASEAQFLALPDDRVLAMMCRTINQAGFNWAVINNKWPQFEADRKSVV